MPAICFIHTRIWTRYAPLRNSARIHDSETSLFPYQELQKSHLACLDPSAVNIYYKYQCCNLIGCLLGQNKEFTVVSHTLKHGHLLTVAWSHSIFRPLQ